MSQQYPFVQDIFLKGPEMEKSSNSLRRKISLTVLEHSSSLIAITSHIFTYVASASYTKDKISYRK